MSSVAAEMLPTGVPFRAPPIVFGGSIGSCSAVLSGLLAMRDEDSLDRLTMHERAGSPENPGHVDVCTAAASGSEPQPTDTGVRVTHARQ